MGLFWYRMAWPHATDTSSLAFNSAIFCRIAVALVYNVNMYACMHVCMCMCLLVYNVNMHACMHACMYVHVPCTTSAGLALHAPRRRLPPPLAYAFHTSGICIHACAYATCMHAYHAWARLVLPPEADVTLTYP